MDMKWRYGSDVGMMPKIIFFLLVLLSIDFYNCIPITDTFNLPVFRQVIGGILLISTLSILFRKNKILFQTEYILLLVSFLFCSVSAYILYNQNFYESLKASLGYIYSLSLYLFALKYKFSEQYIFKVLLVLSLTMLIITLAQQVTYPSYIFCGRVEKEWQQTLEIRMGIYRFTLYGIWLSVLCLMLLFQYVSYSNRNKSFYLLLMALVFLCIVLSLERKVIFACIAALTVGAVFLRGRYSVSKILLAIFLIAVFSILPDYMEDLNVQTNNEVSNSRFVRYLSMHYYFYDMNSSPLFYAFGAGLPGKSELWNLVERMQEMYGFYQEDVGVVGYISKAGFFGLFIYSLIFFKIVRYRKYIDAGLLLFFLSMLMVIVFKFLGNAVHNLSAFAIFMYLVEINIKKKKYNLKKISE